MSDNLQSFDIEHLNDISNGDEDFKKELIGIFLEQIPEFVNNMNEFFDEKKFDKLAREAHTAKSSVLIFGMADTGLLLKDIQHLAENNEGPEIQPKLKQVEMELNKVKNDLMILLKEWK